MRGEEGGERGTRKDERGVLGSGALSEESEGQEEEGEQGFLHSQKLVAICFAVAFSISCCCCCTLLIKPTPLWVTLLSFGLICCFSKGGEERGGDVRVMVVGVERGVAEKVVGREGGVGGTEGEVGGVVSSMS